MNDKQIIEAHEAHIEEQGNLISQQASAFSRFFENLRSLGVDDSILYKSMRGIKAPPQWSKEWPTEPGYYWAYGDFSGRGIDKQLLFVDVVDFLGLLYSANGKTLSPKAHELAWTPAILPDTSGAVALLEESENA